MLFGLLTARGEIFVKWDYVIQYNVSDDMTYLFPIQRCKC